MRLALVFAAVALVLAYVVFRQNAAIRDQQKALTDLRAQVAATQNKPQTNTLDLQEKCARQAQEAFKRDGFEGEKGALFSNHYNEKLNKCFVQIESSDWKTAPGTVFTNKVLSDAFEGKVYAEYMWHSDKVKKYWEVPPLQCSVTLLSGEEKSCRSSDEFDALVKVYME